MNRSMRITLIVLVALSLMAGLSLQNPVKAAAKLKIAVVTDVGKVDDGGFNQSAWEGAQAGAQAIGSDKPDVVETENSADYASNIGLFADKGYDIIVTVGFGMGDATAAAAKKYPKIQFLGVDQFQGAEIPNVTGIIFHEDVSGFLAGVLAARLTKSGIVGGVYGTDQVPPVVNFKEGYEHGAAYASKGKVKVLSTYNPNGLDKAFTDPVWGAQTADQELTQGADIIFAAAGKTGNGALIKVAEKTTKDKPLYCIGVDTDQWLTVPEAHPCLVSSAVKLIVPAVTELIQAISDGSIAKLHGKDGNYFGKAGLASFHDFEKMVPAEVVKELADIKAMLDSGELKTDGTMAAAATPAATAAK